MGIAKSIGIAMLIDIFDIFETISQIHFTLCGDVPWVSHYHVPSNGRGPVIFDFLMNFWFNFWPIK